jgi:hypothetical protein
MVDKTNSFHLEPMYSFLLEQVVIFAEECFLLKLDMVSLATSYLPLLRNVSSWN